MSWPKAALELMFVERSMALRSLNRLDLANSPQYLAPVVATNSTLLTTLEA